MEYVEGTPLSRLVPAGGLPPESVIRYGTQIADALAHAHERGIVHRDLKSGNVVVTPEGRAKVLDFGLAARMPQADAEAVTKTQEAIPHAGKLVGTLAYMAPEVLRGEAATARSDIWALGVLLHEMASGRAPFAGRTGIDLASAIVRESPAPLTGQISVGFRAVVQRCLTKEPRQRYATAAEVRAALEAMEIGVPAVDRTSSDADRPRFRRGSLALAGGAVAAAALLIAFIVSGRGGPVERGETPGAITSLAVLPLDNLMGDPEQAYFVDGMHEALITNLSRLGALRVISRTSVMRYRETDKTIPEIADELDVNALVEGSVLRLGDEIRITAQLIHGQTDEHLWADSYDREYRSVLALLSEVAGAIAGEIEVAVTPGERARLAAARTVDPEAYEAYLKGLYYWNLGTGEDLRMALEFHQTALDIDPTYALAHSGAASTHLLLGAFGHAPLAQEATAARAAAMRALELDEELDDAHTVLGWVELYFDRDWPEAARAFERALAINPNHSFAHHGYADYLTLMGRPDEAVEHVVRGRQSNPMVPLTSVPVVGHLYLGRRYDEALDECRRLLALGPRYLAVRSWCAGTLWHMGRYDEALAAYRLLWEGDPARSLALDQGMEEAGPRDALRAVARRMAALPTPGVNAPLPIARLFALAGEVDDAFEWLERAYERRAPQLVLIGARPAYDEMRADPRFAELTRRIGLPE